MKAQTRIDRALLQRRLAPLLASWERQAHRIDGLSLRERAILFLCIVAVLAALFETTVLSPLSAKGLQRQAVQTQQTNELTQQREQFILASRDGSDPGSALRAQLDTARAERARLDEALRKAASLSEDQGVSIVLQRLLTRQPGLVLERLKLMDDVPVTIPAAASAPAAPQSLTFAGMSWQGVELQLQGSYHDIQRYLQALEHELPGLRWGELRLSAAGAGEPPRLQAQLFLLKVQP